MLNLLAFWVLFTATSVGFLANQSAPLRAPKDRVTKASGSHDGENQPNPQDSNKSSPKTVSSGPQPPAPTCDESCKQGRQNLAIQRNLELFTGGLVIVGFLQVGTMIWQAFLLRQTRNDVHSQAETMAATARKDIEDSAASAITTQKIISTLQQQAHALGKQADNQAKKERARIIIERISPVENEAEDGPFPGIILVSNNGPAYAFNVSCRMNCFINRERNLTEAPQLFEQEIPVMLKSLDMHRIEWEMFTPLSDDLLDAEGNSISNEECFFHIFVVVSYCDIFGDMPDSILHMRWNVDIEDDIETGDEDYPYAPGPNYSKWIRVPQAPANPN